MTPLVSCKGYENVFVIGEERLWGYGYGENAITASLAKAFLELRANKVIAKIDPENSCSLRSITSCGFQKEEKQKRLLYYGMTMDGYLTFLKRQAFKGEKG